MSILSHATLVVTRKADEKLRQNPNVLSLLNEADDKEMQSDQILYYFESLKVYEDDEGNEFHFIVNTLSEEEYLLTKLTTENMLEYGTEFETFGELESEWLTDVEVSVKLTYYL